MGSQSKKWFYEPQKEIEKHLQSQYKGFRFIRQHICPQAVYETYMVEAEESVQIVLFQMVKTEYGRGYQLFKFNPTNEAI